MLLGNIIEYLIYFLNNLIANQQLHVFNRLQISTKHYKYMIVHEILSNRMMCYEYIKISKPIYDAQLHISILFLDHILTKIEYASCISCLLQ